MSFVIALGYWLEEHTRWVAHISGLMLIIIIASLLSNAGVVPSTLESYEIYFKWLMPIGIILMLFAFNPAKLLKVNKNFIICFVIGALGTTLGGIIAGIICQKLLQEDYWRISAQFTASFIGGYENAVSVGSALNTPAPVFLKAFAGDSIFTMLWIIVNIFQGRKIGKTDEIKSLEGENNSIDIHFSNSLDTASVAIMITTALILLMVSMILHQYLPFIPQILWATTFATLATFTPLKQRFAGSYILGSFILSYFVFGCGAISDVGALFNDGIILLAFPAIIILVHAVVLFTSAKILKIDKEISIIASQCLIGGPATALVVVSARGWNYQLEAIALGLLGYAIGNYFGFGVAWILK